jgi:Zn-dependent protease with chaperone function
MINIIIFIIFFLVIVNWFQIISFFSLFVGPKIKTSTIKDEWIKNVVKKKTGLNLFDLTLFHDKKIYGMMAGLSFWPKMILSTGLYESLNKDELEWVILHEAGHCILWHNLQSFFIEMIMLVIGIYLININKINLFFIPIHAILLSIVSIHLIRWTTEYVADKYSINLVDNPRGVITAQNKFKKSFLRFLFHWNISSTLRIKMAKRRLMSTTL